MIPGTPMLQAKRLARELSLDQLLNALDSKLDGIAKIKSSQADAATLQEIDKAVPRIWGIWRKAKTVKNSLAPINRLPPEMLALVAAFLNPERELMNAVMVCQYWRETLLSFPRLWSEIRCSDQVRFEMCLKRSKSVPLRVQMHYSHDRLFESLTPHLSRLASLSVLMDGSSDFFRWIAYYLGRPIPTLREFSIAVPMRQNTLELPSDIRNDHFQDVQKLRLEGISSFRAPRAFPNVTEFNWHVKSYGPVPVTGFLDTVKQFPALERVEIEFHTRYHYIMPTPTPRAVTLPHVHRVSLLCANGGPPPILQYLKLPSLTSLFIETAQISPWPFSVLPNGSFDQNLPKYAELPEMRVYACIPHGRVRFLTSSEASLEYHTPGRSLGEKPYPHDRNLWGDIPLDSVRKLIVAIDIWSDGSENAWLVRLMQDLRSLDHLEIWGSCADALRHLGQQIISGVLDLRIKTLTVRSGESGLHEAFNLKDVTDGLGLGVVFNFVLYPENSVWYYAVDPPEPSGWNEAWH